MSRQHLGGTTWLMLNGVPSQRTVYQCNLINYEITAFGGVHKQFINVGMKCGLTMNFVVPEETLADVVKKIDLINDRSNFVTLGPGWVCQYCGDYNVAGLIKCMNCGGSVAQEPYACINNFPFVITNSTYDSMGPITVLSVTFEFWRQDKGSNHLFSGTDIRSLPYSYTLNKNLYVCQYCGRTVELGRKCDGCGGGRLPLSEVVQMDTTCLYCGNQITGGIVCPTCGGFLKATAYREIKGVPNE